MSMGEFMTKAFPVELALSQARDEGDFCFFFKLGFSAKNLKVNICQMYGLFVGCLGAYRAYRAYIQDCHLFWESMMRPYFGHVQS